MLHRSRPLRLRFLRAHSGSKTMNRTGIDRQVRPLYCAESLEARFLLAAATHYGVVLPSSVTAGIAFNFTVTALDASNLAATGYSGTLHFASTDSNGTMPANSLMSGSSQQFSATFRTASTRLI